MWESKERIRTAICLMGKTDGTDLGWQTAAIALNAEAYAQRDMGEEMGRKHLAKAAIAGKTDDLRRMAQIGITTHNWSLAFEAACFAQGINLLKPFAGVAAASGQGYLAGLAYLLSNEPALAAAVTNGSHLFANVAVCMGRPSAREDLYDLYNRDAYLPSAGLIALVGALMRTPETV